MNLELYKRNQELRKQQEPRFRVKCLNCRQPEFSCYCGYVKQFDPHMDFVILIHPLEVRRRIATGRMSHLCLKNSFLFEGQDFSNDERVTKIAKDPNRHCVILYPGIGSTNLTPLEKDERSDLLSTDKRLTVFVIDGTWRTARKMVRSTNLNEIQRICFSPEKPSNFRVRKQPHAGCYSTIEAIHHLIGLIGHVNHFNVENREHDNLIHAFDSMVEFQLKLMKEKYDDPKSWRVMAPRKKRLNV